ncbi:MAG: hypothetical protein ACYSR6_11835 [Planctomycetota bacterium]|jgi:hypothetical protein
MNKTKDNPLVLLGVLTSLMLMAGFALANGGPFVLKYPNGDPAAKGILARLDPDLKPARETRLRVIKEDLKVTFGKDGRRNQHSHPLAHVIAEYTVENPTADQIEIDFGFPILRGVFINPRSMRPSPAVDVTIGEKHIRATIISNSAIYGIIRRRARDIIEKAVAEDQTLASLVASIRGTTGDANHNARQALSAHLADSLKWTERDAALMVEYVSLDLGQPKAHPWDRDRTGWAWSGDKELNELTNANLGPLAAIGEQKTTQFFAQLAGCFNPKAAATYEAIFSAWGGDVRERSVDLKTGAVRPREITVDTAALNESSGRMNDPTIYARVNYLDPKANITEPEKASCKAILKNLPVIFTYAPMNLLHYRVSFPAKSTQTLTVSYRQYAYSDTHAPSSYQLAYVVHPASFWQDFGPINLEVAVPEGVNFRASVPCHNGGVEERQVFLYGRPDKIPCEVYRAELKQKTGELYLAVDAEAWKNGGQKVAADHPNERLQQVARKAQDQKKH